MPIVSRQINAIHPQRRGAVRVTGEAVDTKGKSHQFRHDFVPSDTVAVAAFNAAKFDWDNADRLHRKAIRQFKQGSAEAEAARLVVEAVNPALTDANTDLIAAATSEAEAVLTAKDFTLQLQEIEENQMIEHIEQGGTPDTYVSAEFTILQKRRFALKRMIKKGMKTDQLFLCGMGDFVANFSVAQIANAAQISTTKATKVRNRAIRLRDTICPALNLDEADVD